MRVFFLNPGGAYTHEYPPLGILYLVSAVRERGHSVAFFDEGICRSDAPLKNSISEFKPDLIAVSLYTSNILKTFDTISCLKKLFPLVKIAAGGPHATVLPERTMQECEDIDYVVVGEGEITLNELIESLEEKIPVTTVGGLCFRDGNKIKINPPRALIEDLDLIPMPAFDLIQTSNYAYDPVKTGKKIATIMTSRGCPYECAFCAAKAVWGNFYRKRSAKNVVKEIKVLTEKYNYDEIYFMDDLFAINTKWLNEFYEEMKKQNIHIPWKCLGRVDALKFEDYKKMADNGCYLVQLGVESGDNEVLKDINKRITTDQAVYAFEAARKAGLNTYAFFIFGHKKDTYETIHKTIRFAKRLMPDFVSFFALVPFPGTKIYEELSEDLKYNWKKIVYTSWHKDQMPFKLSEVESEDLIFFEQQSYSEIYVSLRYILNNIIFSKARRKLIRLKLSFIKAYISGKMSQFLKRKSVFSVKKRVNDVDNKAFTDIWNDWRAASDITPRIDFHIRDRKPFVEIISKYIDKSGAKQVLEIGCGTAIDSYCLAKKYGKNICFHATDISAEALEVAGKVGGIMKSEIKLSVDDLEHMQFEDNKFDIIFSQGVMEHFRDPVPALNEQIRVLKKGGYLIVDVPQKYNPYTLYKAVKIKKNQWEYGWETEYSYGKLRDLGANLGLTPVDVGSHGYGYFEDYGFSLFPMLIRKLSNPKKGGILSRPASFVLKMLEKIERKFGHYFMQNITVVFKK